MEGFLSAIPDAARSGYAFGAYAICALLFLFGGAKLRELRSILGVIKDVPASQRAALIQATTGRLLPKHITAEQWIRHSRNQGFISLGAGMLIAASVVAIVAMKNSDPPPGPPPPFSEATKVVNSLLAQMDAGQYSDAWQDFYSANKRSMPIDRWLALSKIYRAPLGNAESRIDAGSTASEIRLDRRLNGLLIQYYTKFEHLQTPIVEQVGVTSPGAPTPWKIVSYTVAVPPGSPVLQQGKQP
jgi:hypothetical protein